MSQVIVLLPNARRQTVKVTPNTTILEIIEQVCTKAELVADEHDLKHHRTILDSTTTVRFAALPQNAQLELVQAKTKRKESNVILCVQLESGERLQGECQPTNTLWQAISQIVPHQAETCSNPVVIYMRREIIGLESLAKTTLREIGLNGGRAVVRLVDKRLEELRVQANVSAPLVRPPKQENEEVEKPRPVSELELEAKANEERNRSIKIDEQETKEEALVEKLEKMECENILDSSRERGTPVVSPIESTPCNNFIVKSADAETILLAEPEEANNCKRARTKSPDVAESVEHRVIEKVVLLGERNAVAYNLDTIPAPSIEDLPDDFYEITLADVKKLAAAARRAVQEIEECPLLTSEQRKLDEDGLILQRLSAHKTCIIRVRFPDRTVLQGVFKPIETVGDVHNFVQSYLEQPTLQFYLYTSPPKKTLDLEARLVEADCVPGANIYFGLLSQEQPKFFLKSDVLNNFSTYSAVTKTARESSAKLGNNYASSTQSDKKLEEPQPGPSRLTVSGHARDKTRTDNSDVPKWFKFGK